MWGEADPKGTAETHLGHVPDPAQPTAFCHRNGFLGKAVKKTRGKDWEGGNLLLLSVSSREINLGIPARPEKQSAAR